MKVDLHIHSCLSPCALLTMGPRTIVQRAKELNIDIIGLTDHNSALNTPAMEKVCLELGLGFIPGMEVTTREEAHCLCLFPSVDVALEFGKLVSARQPKVPNKPHLMGDQIVVDEEEYVVDEVPYWLNAPTDIGWEELGDLVHQFQGLWVPAHIDRSHGGVISQLGFLPQANYDAVEVVDAHFQGETWGKKRLRHSDAHAPEHIGRRWWELPNQEGRVWEVVQHYLTETDR